MSLNFTHRAVLSHIKVFIIHLYCWYYARTRYVSKHAVLVMCQSDGKSEANVLAGSLSKSTVWARNNIAACFGEQRDGLSAQIKITWREKRDQEQV